MYDAQTGLVYLRARYYAPASGRFVSRDTWGGNEQLPITFNLWLYANGNPVKYVDPSGYSSVTVNGRTINCPVGLWNCEAVTRVAKLKTAFLNSASRHNRIPTMDNNGFAALIASVIVAERRVGNVPPITEAHSFEDIFKKRTRPSIWLEDLLAGVGCIVSGHSLFEASDNRERMRYFFNLEVPQLTTVGIGNVHLNTAANLWKGQACSSLVDVGCTPVSVSRMQVNDVFGQPVDISNPFGPQSHCILGICVTNQPDETESYMIMEEQLLNYAMNIEYVAANLEAGALRAIALGFPPTAFNSAAWHLRGVQTEKEIKDSNWNPGGAVFILDDIPTALAVLGINSTWNLSMEP